MYYSINVVSIYQFSKACRPYELLIFSYKRRLYHHPIIRTFPISTHLSVLAFAIVVKLYSIRVLAFDYPLSQCLGFNHAPSIWFFLLSSHSRLCHLRYYVLVQIVLGVSSNSSSIGRNNLIRHYIYISIYADYSTN